MHRDVEGNDDFHSPFNTFTPQCIHLMGLLSQLAKRAGYLVAMAPAESYLDPTTELFDLTLTHTYPEWDRLQPDFRYHGHNTYAYLLARYGTTALPLLSSTLPKSLPEALQKLRPVGATVASTEGVTGVVAEGFADGVAEEVVVAAGVTAGVTGVVADILAAGVAEVVPTFDFVTVQLYEGYSHAHYQSYVRGRPASQVLAEWVQVRPGQWVEWRGMMSYEFVPQTLTSSHITSLN